MPNRERDEDEEVKGGADQSAERIRGVSNDDDDFDEDETEDLDDEEDTDQEGTF